MPRKTSKVIQVPVDEDLLRQLDELSDSQGVSRSAVIREACAVYIANAEEAELDRQYMESYRKLPPTEEELALAQLGTQLLTKFFAEEDAALEKG